MQPAVEINGRAMVSGHRNARRMVLNLKGGGGVPTGLFFPFQLSVGS